MRRKKFIADLGKGLVAYSIFPNELQFSIPNKNFPNKLREKENEVYRPEGYHLIWEDNFDGVTLDESEWYYRMDLKIHSAQRPENVKLEDGKLVLAMKKDDFLGMKYSGAGIATKRRWQHGYYEVKAKLSHAPGWHHSFWASAGNGFLTFSSDRLMEIDAMEVDAMNYGGMNASNHNLWTDRDGWSSKERDWASSHAQDLGFKANDGYHIYGFEYNSEGIGFYVDGEKVHNISASEDEYKHYSLNLWLTVIATHSNSDTDLPAYDYYDYIRCYSKNQNVSLSPKIIKTYESHSPIYIDNYDPWGFNIGTYWELSTEGNSFYGRNYYKRKPGKSFDPLRDWALFRPYISESGNYDIYLRWPTSKDNSINVPLEIWYDGGKEQDTSKSINQQEHDGKWVKIGRYFFNEGWNNMIKLIATGPGYTVADAAKFVKD